MARIIISHTTGSLCYDNRDNKLKIYFISQDNPLFILDNKKVICNVYFAINLSDIDRTEISFSEEIENVPDNFVDIPAFITFILIDSSSNEFNVGSYSIKNSTFEDIFKDNQKHKIYFEDIFLNLIS